LPKHVRTNVGSPPNRAKGDWKLNPQ
jgi:hypothetical protein